MVTKLVQQEVRDLSHSGHHQECLDACKNILQKDPQNPAAWKYAGKSLFALGQIEEAKQHLSRAHQLDSDDPETIKDLGNIFNALLNYVEAKRLYNSALAIEPNYAPALNNLGLIAKRQGDFHAAKQLIKKAADLDPLSSPYHLNLGSIDKELGNLDQALDSTLKSLELNPDNPLALYNLGSIYKDLRKLDQAVDSILKSLELNPDNPRAHMALGLIKMDLGDESSGLESLRKAYELDPSPTNACLSKLYLPNISSSEEETKREIKIYMTNLVEIFTASKPKERKGILDLYLFGLTYKNLDDERQLLEKIGKIVHPWFKVDLVNESINRQAKVPLPKNRDESDTLRVGFYFDNPQSNHAITRHYLNLVKSCNEQNLEVILIKGPKALGKESKDLSEIASETVQISYDLETSVQSLREMNLKVLIYTEMYSSPMPYGLAHNKIAPIQIVLPGNNMTTGLPSMDYFITGKAQENERSQDFYTEKLIRVNGIPTGYNEVAASPDKKYNRDYFDIPHNIKVISLMHNPIKFHPEWVRILEEIAQCCPGILFLLSNWKYQASALAEKWKHQAPTLLTKCRFVNFVPKAQYQGLQNCSDVLLDPLYRGCGTTAFDAFAMGIPIVTMPKTRSRSRLIYGLYKIMEIQNAPIAHNKSEYINFCKRLLIDSEYNAELRSSIKNGYGRLLESNQQSVAEITDFITRVASTHDIDGNQKARGLHE